MSFDDQNFNDRTADWGRANQWFKDNLWRIINEELSVDNKIPTAFILGELDYKFDELWEEYEDWFAEPKQAEKGGEKYWHKVSVVFIFTLSSYIQIRLYRLIPTKSGNISIIRSILSIFKYCFATYFSN